MKKAICSAVLTLSLAADSAIHPELQAASFLFGTEAGGASNVIYNQIDRAAATLSADGSSAIFQAGPAGGLLDDRDSQGLGISTSALPGVTDVFTLTYGEGNYDEVPGYRTNPAFPPQTPNAVGNGSRLQGLIVSVVPEPGSLVLGLFACGLGLGMARRRNGAA